jgi:hypothetical protein
LATMVLWAATIKWISHFISVMEGPNTWFLWDGYQGQGEEWHHSNF